MGLDDLDPRRLEVAAHELGHAIAWKEAGLAATAIRVLGHGDRAQGYVRIENRLIYDADAARAYLAGLLAGREAGIRWCEENGLTHYEHTCHTDLNNFRQQRRTPLGRQVSVGQARATARLIVRANWCLIVRLAPRLALQGRITL